MYQLRNKNSNCGDSILAKFNNYRSYGIDYGYVAAILCCGATLQRCYATSMLRWCVELILFCSGDMLQLHCSDARLQRHYSNTMLRLYIAAMLCCSQVVAMPFWCNTSQWYGVAGRPFCSDAMQLHCWEICYIYVTWMPCCRYIAANYFAAINSSDTLVQGSYVTAILQRYAYAAIHSSDTVMQWCDVTATLQQYYVEAIHSSNNLLQGCYVSAALWWYYVAGICCSGTVLSRYSVVGMV